MADFGNKLGGRHLESPEALILDVQAVKKLCLLGALVMEV